MSLVCMLRDAAVALLGLSRCVEFARETCIQFGVDAQRVMLLDRVGVDLQAPSVVGSLFLRKLKEPWVLGDVIKLYSL